MAIKLYENIWKKLFLVNEMITQMAVYKIKHISKNTVC